MNKIQKKAYSIVSQKHLKRSGILISFYDFSPFLEREHRECVSRTCDLVEHAQERMNLLSNHLKHFMEVAIVKHRAWIKNVIIKWS